MATTDTKQVVVQSVSVGLQLLPFFVQGIETLFGKKTGETKKQAVTQLYQAAITGTLAGLGLAGNTEAAEYVSQLAPIGSAAIDAVAGQLTPSSSTPAPAVPPSATNPTQIA